MPPVSIEEFRILAREEAYLRFVHIREKGLNVKEKDIVCK